MQLSDVATEAGGLALRTVRGSQCDYVKEGEHHLTAAIDEVEMICRRIDSCVEHAQAYRRALG
ncbi:MULTISPECIES: hypothetical protein [unclassified Solwaraspora]|uniref:hypothetical protein n=1 Tax=unclassified Solwaraspora TaxID=2627926 RepID=UPI00259BBDE8|nr:hypothetical protein [Solwaraspora sp. WMMA2056]WJK42092.1 hypothetical protein O7608_06785 [Solwaraspora sp. WMMA2056]